MFYELPGGVLRYCAAGACRCVKCVRRNDTVQLLVCVYLLYIDICIWIFIYINIYIYNELANFKTSFIERNEQYGLCVAPLGLVLNVFDTLSVCN